MPKVLILMIVSKNCKSVTKTPPKDQWQVASTHQRAPNLKCQILQLEKLHWTMRQVEVSAGAPTEDELDPMTESLSLRLISLRKPIKMSLVVLLVETMAKTKR